MDVRRNGLSTWSLPPWCKMDWMDFGSLRMMCKPASCDKRLCMINAILAAISNVHGSHYLCRVLHEVITICIVGQRLLESCTLCSESEMSVENYMLSF